MKTALAIFFMLFSGFTFAINPKKEYISTPSKYSIEYKEVFINNNGVQIYAWISEPKEIIKNNAKTIILAYGDYGNMSYYLPYIDFYTKLGFMVISFDYRGFGKSSPFLIDPNELFYNEFALDLENVISYCKKDLKIQDIGIVSLSMGTIMTSIAIQNERTQFVIAEGCVYDTNSIVNRLKTIKQKEVTVNNKFNISDQWKSITSKILIFVADNDQITTISDAEKIILQDTSKRNLIIYQGDHLGMLNNVDDLEYYKQQINLFINGN
jgi:predicted alpha/beta-fold hydrolase